MSPLETAPASPAPAPAPPRQPTPTWTTFQVVVLFGFLAAFLTLLIAFRTVLFPFLIFALFNHPGNAG